MFFDTEVTSDGQKLLDIGAIKDNGSVLRTYERSIFSEFTKGCRYICGHNIFNHDLGYVKEDIESAGSDHLYIDTLHLSPLLFPNRPYHKLLKDDKLQIEELNNPLNDAIKARDLFFDEVSSFRSLNPDLADIYASLLYNDEHFSAFFNYLNVKPFGNPESKIKKYFDGSICSNADLKNIITEYPAELAYSLALISTKDKHSITPPWVLKAFPKTNEVINLLTNTPCEKGCRYCSENLNVKKRLKSFFGFDNFRSYNNEPLQENAVKAATEGKSLLAIFPTGGGKSITFQLPALIASETCRGLTVVISPLQSLMKDQVDNLEKKGIVDAVTINGLLNPIERADAIKRVANGIASILYISPESLRSSTIEKLLVSRNVVRFVIDEAHCFSAWGQDFRVDYMYIGPFIRMLCEKKKLDKPIPVSCFTATAKKKVVSDILEYFNHHLGVNLELFTTSAQRQNLHYQVKFVDSEEEKYSVLRNIIQSKKCPTIVYVSRTAQTGRLADRLSRDGFPALPYNGKMESSEKIQNQNMFMSGDVNIIVATSAFGMGVDKDNVELVIHYEISNSLENYVQEAGRAGRNQAINAECYVLFNDSDLDKHFSLLAQTKLSINEIQQVWKAIKTLSKNSGTLVKSPLEIARAAGWDESILDIETRVKTAVAALENAGFLKRDRNVPRIYATGILAHNMQEAAEIINQSSRFDENQKTEAKRIIKFLISRRSNAKANNDDAESRVDYIADRLGVTTESVVDMVNLMREEGLLADSQDMSAKVYDSRAHSRGILKAICEVESFLIDHLPRRGEISYKELNERAVRSGVTSSTVKNIKTVLLYWMINHDIKKSYSNEGQRCTIEMITPSKLLQEKHDKRTELSYFLVDYLHEKQAKSRDKSLVPFSILELTTEFNQRDTFLSSGMTASSEDIKDALLFLAKINALELEDGFVVFHNAIHITREENSGKMKYKKENYQSLDDFYKQRIQQIHIVGEYAHLMVKDYNEALTFVNDYFGMDYQLFRQKYFKGDRLGEIQRNITPEKHNQLFGGLSAKQRKIISDDRSKHIVVAAGPGSGKTKLLVHKLASLLMLEDTRTDQLLMLTFSRSAATEFKKRLLDLIGGAAYYVEIKTFHSYSFDLIGRIGNLEESEDIVKKAAEMIRRGEVDAGRITKTVLVIDEAQDMDINEFRLVSALMDKNEYMRVIAVGDDDQNIYEFRGSDSKYLKSLVKDFGAKQYELLENYRSSWAVVALANRFASTMSGRLKTKSIVPVLKEKGTVELTKFTSPNLEIPTLNKIKSTCNIGSCCVLTATNDEAVRMTGLLNKSGYHAKLIQSNEGFNLNSLRELKFFSDYLLHNSDGTVISDELWSAAKGMLFEKFKISRCLPECLKMIDLFSSTARKKYLSDFIDYISESNYDDFFSLSDDTILVSTIHKSKGREFDNVYLMLGHQKTFTDKDKRAVYVGLTRAKKNLYINYNNTLFDNIAMPEVSVSRDDACYPETDEIMLQVDHKGVYLDYFKKRQSQIQNLYSGSQLFYKDSALFTDPDFKGDPVVVLSKSCAEIIDSLKDKGFVPISSDVRFTVFWKDKDDKECLIVLPNIIFARMKNEDIRPCQ